MNSGTSDAGYWDSFYSMQRSPELPSQFALFVANELLTGQLPEPAAIVDIGCGNGRDCLFFARLGFATGGIDRSPAAIAACAQRLERELGAEHPMPVLCAGEADQDDLDRLAGKFSGPLLLYSRFFFHAIDAAAEARVIANASAILARRGGALATEFRTLADAASIKETPQHYRRFIDPDAFADRLGAAGLSVQWRAEGRGMAKYRADDAHVARLIAAP